MQKKRTRITQSGKNCAINCAIQGVRLIWKQKIWLAFLDFFFIIDQSECLVCFLFLHWINSFLHCFKKKTALLLTNQNGEIFSYTLLGMKYVDHRHSKHIWQCWILMQFNYWVYIIWNSKNKLIVKTRYKINLLELYLAPLCIPEEIWVLAICLTSEIHSDTKYHTIYSTNKFEMPVGLLSGWNQQWHYTY